LESARARAYTVQEPWRRRLDQRIAQVDQDIQNLHGDLMTDPSWQNIRIHVMGKLNDQLGHATNQAERAMVAEHALERETLAGQLHAAWQSGSQGALAHAREARILALRGHRAKMNELLDQQQLLQVSKQQLEEGVGKLRGGGTLPDLQAEIAARGAREPFYIPDVSATEAGRRTRFASPEGSISPTRAKADIYNSQQLLFRTGMLAMHPDVLGPSFLRMAKHDFYTALHETAVKLATPIPKGEHLPKGMEWLKTKYGQSIPPLEQLRGEHLRQTADVYGGFDAEHELTSKLAELDPAQIMHNDKGYRLAIPSGFANEFRSEFKSGSIAMSKFVQVPLTVWRGLILHLRIPWLTNNILGNMLLTTLRYMGPSGLRSVMGLIYDTKGAAGVRRALGMKDIRNHLTEDDIRELLPGQMRGTFLGANLPPGILGTGFGQDVGSAAVKASNKVMGFLPSIDRRTEQAFRRVAAESVLRGSPEVRALYKAMPKQTRSWRAAMRKGLEDPQLQQFVMREVNDGLGDFLSLSRNERTMIRQVVPFYAWMREITRITAKTALDTPGRASVITRLGLIGAENSAQDVPPYLQGGIPIGGAPRGYQTVLNLRGAVPYTSTIDAAKALAYLGGASNRETARAFTGNLNPFLSALITSTGKALEGNAPASVVGGLPGALVDTVKQLPQYRAIFPPKSSIYLRGRNDLLYQLLGDPRRTYDVSAASGG